MSITAPYNFVPLSKKVFFPDWADKISHDIPFEDGVSGTLQLKITAHTPLLIGDRQSKNERGSTVVEPFQLPPRKGESEGRYAIPGTSLRGMIRNVLEIASFGKMQGVDDRRYAVRDLSGNFYKQLLTRGTPHQGIHFKSESGWLKYQNGQWELTPCQYARVEQTDLRNYNNTQLTQAINQQDEASDKYRLWLDTHETTNISFDTTDDAINQNARHHLPLHYRLANNLGAGEKNGKLVLTGQPGPNKHMEFIFYEPATRAIKVPDAKMQDFLFTYGETDHWKYLKQHETEDGIPVFFLREAQALHSIGLSQMYRVAYKNTIHDAISNTSKDHLDEVRRDLAELIFGYTDDEVIENGLKGRVSFSHAVCEQAQVTLDTKTTILNSPKPTYYPNYIKQDATGEQLNNDIEYNTLMSPNAELRGWKRYPVRSHPNVPVPDAEQGDAVRSVITALQTDGGLDFSAKLRFHNLKETELGALIWAIEWGGNKELRHAIGMGKAFGYGQLSIEVFENESQIIANGKAISLTDCQQSFCVLMSDSIEKWDSSNQLYQLTKMADPSAAPGNNEALEHMELADYLDSKTNNFVLPTYAIQTTPATWLSANINYMVSQNSSLDPKKLYFQMGLAKKWASIPDPVLKAGVKDAIKDYWNEARGEDFWDNPVGKNVIGVRSAYDK